MPNIKNNASAQETRRKLIAAAGQVFAEKGLHAATLQEITALAGANKASVNYHFRDKYELYMEVVRYALTFRITQISPEDRRGTPEEQLKKFILRMMTELLDPLQPPWRAVIVIHELAQPTKALDAVMTNLFEPKSRHMFEITQVILGPNASEEIVSRFAVSIAAQCIFYLYGKEIMRRMYPVLDKDTSVDKIATHITNFSLAALHAMKKQINSKRRSR